VEERTRPPETPIIDVMRAVALEEIAKLPPPPAPVVDGAEIERMVTAEVERRLPALVSAAVAALPPPKDGTSVTLDEVAPLIAESVAKAIAALPAAKDGVGLAGAVIDRAGSLVVTLTDGSTHSLGCVVGRDVTGEEVAQFVAREVAKIPAPKDGADGLGFDDLDVTYDGARTFTLRFLRGDKVKEFSFALPVQIDRGVWKDGEWQAGDAVTWAGSSWIAQCVTTAKPGTNDDWRLAVKRGRDGASAYDLAVKGGFKGNEREWLASLKGEPGRDLTKR